MASSNIARLGVVLALDTAAFTADVNKAIAETKNLKAAIQRESNAAAKEIVALKYATEDYGKEVSKVTQIEREIAAGRFKNASPLLQQQLLAQARAYDDVAKSAKNLNAGLNDQQKLALTYQTTDFITQIASGQNALIAMLQQGGQLKDQMGGIGPMFTAIRMALTPMVLGMTAAAAAVGTLGFAFYQGAKESADLRDQLILTGNYANLTQKTFLDLADTVSAKTNLSIGKTKDILMELVKSGKFTDQSMGSVAQAIANVAKLSGETASEVAQKLIPAFDGGAGSIKSLNDKMHFLTLAQYKQIEALHKQGKTQEAAKIAADALNKKFGEQERKLGDLERMWEKLKNTASATWNALLNIGKPMSPEEEIEQVTKFIIDAAKAINNANPESIFYDKAMQGLKAHIAKRQELIAKMEGDQSAAKKAQKEQKDINDYTEHNKQRVNISFQADQQMLKNKFDLEKQFANDFQRIDIETAEKAQLLINEMDRKNKEEGGKVAEQNAKKLSADLYALDIAAQEKRIELIKKKYAAEYSAWRDLQDEFDKAWGQENARADASRKAVADRLEEERKSLQYDIEKAKLQQSLIGQSDKTVQLAMLELETKRQIKELDSNRDLTEGDKAKRIEEILRNQSMKEVFINLQDSIKKTQQVYDAVFGNMERALENFVRTGKLSFKDLARSIIQDLILIQLKASATSLFRMFMGSLGFGSSSGALPSLTGQFGVGPTGFANGGDPPVGRASIVGERGPELFVPRTAGTIIPNHALSSLGGSQVVNNYNIQAIDVKSFEDRIMGSSTAVWAANAYANKSLAIGRGRA